MPVYVTMLPIASGRIRINVSTRLILSGFLGMLLKDVVEHGRAGEPLAAVPHGELRRVRAAGQCVHLASSSAFTLGVLLDMSA